MIISNNDPRESNREYGWSDFDAFRKARGFRRPRETIDRRAVRLSYCSVFFPYFFRYEKKKTAGLRGSADARYSNRSFQTSVSRVKKERKRREGGGG